MNRASKWTVAIGATMLALSGVGAYGGISGEQARSVAEEACGGSLGEASPKLRQLEGGAPVADFSYRDEKLGQTWSLSVNLGTGKLLSYRRSAGSAPAVKVGGLHDEEAIAIAKAEAERLMGADDAHSLTWSIDRSDPRLFVVNGHARGEAVSDPDSYARPVPVNCNVELDPQTRLVRSYFQVVPLERGVVRAEVTKERALAIAREAMRDRAAVPEEGYPPRLHQNVSGHAVWTLRLLQSPGAGGGDGASALTVIDAHSGEVLSCEFSTEEVRKSGDWTPRQRTAGPAGTASGAEVGGGVAAPPWSSDRMRALPMAVVSIAIVLCAGAGLILLRRRR